MTYDLTPVELELMDILWSLGEGTVHDVLAGLPNDRDLAYTSVSTILRILQQKKIVAIKKIGRQHIYKPMISKDLFATHSVNKIITQVFSGKSVELVANLINKNQISLDDIKAIQKLISSKKKELAEC